MEANQNWLFLFVVDGHLLANTLYKHRKKLIEGTSDCTRPSVAGTMHRLALTALSGVQNEALLLPERQSRKESV